jgi:hypothetical protein
MTRITAAITAHLCAVALFALAIAATGPASI